MADRLLDVHCHLDLYQNPGPVVARAKLKNVGIVAVTTTPFAYQGNLERFGSVAIVGLGMHPELALSHHADLDLFQRLLDKAALIGEIGLDGRPQNRHTWNQQVAIFERVLTLVEQQRRPLSLSIHSPYATAAVIERLELFVPNIVVRKILHWFTGTLRDLQRAVALGCFFSINNVMLNNSQSVKLVAKIPLDRILLETDGPATSMHGRAAEPGDIADTALALAAILKSDYEDVVTAIIRTQHAALTLS